VTCVVIDYFYIHWSSRHVRIHGMWMNDEIGSCHPTCIISKNNADNGRKINKCKSDHIWSGKESTCLLWKHNLKDYYYYAGVFKACGKSYKRFVNIASLCVANSIISSSASNKKNNLFGCHVSIFHCTQTIITKSYTFKGFIIAQISLSCVCHVEIIESMEMQCSFMT
jgi:hypothetical protein